MYTHIQSVLGGGLEYLADTLASLGRALDVARSTDLLSDSGSLLTRDRALVHASEVRVGLGVIAEILLAGDKKNGKATAEVKYLGDPLLLNVVKRVR